MVKALVQASIPNVPPLALLLVLGIPLPGSGPSEQLKIFTKEMGHNIFRSLSDDV